MLNSKAEFNRCYIPPLRVVEEEEIKEVVEQKERELQLVGERLGAEDREWERAKRSKRSRAHKSSQNNGGAKRGSREQEEGTRPSKRRKYVLLESDYGWKTTVGIDEKTTSRIEKDDDQDQVSQVDQEQREQEDQDQECSTSNLGLVDPESGSHSTNQPEATSSGDNDHTSTSVGLVTPCRVAYPFPPPRHSESRRVTTLCD